MPYTSDAPDTLERRRADGFAYDPIFDVELARRALAEDVGRGDLTSEATIPARARAHGRIIAKQDGVVAGLPMAALVFRLLDLDTHVVLIAHDGDRVTQGQRLAALEGNARALLTAERTALNFLGRLSGIATLTAQCVAGAAGTQSHVVDTRKTTPGLRALEKYAVRMGGGENHRSGLDDGILIKDNHIAAVGSLTSAVTRARAHASHLIKVEVECEDEAQVREALDAGADAILLDNMTDEAMRAAVELIRERAPRVMIEASGNIGADPQRIAAVAATGVDLISLGALTHSAPNFDVSLEFDVE
ncbi:MAG TPA: carboxylating nicotinate-nucleotide diphosphorylase [Ktedonobacterales bacterium]|jgi:nicotinate-nucleotide pyrophosphorylase (carboxylating)|nr:carboxylating nicotinate-nucleotide diphosphorylase [Ktedonobacterales bacterium]